MDMQKIYAVLTGDLVKSSKLSPADLAASIETIRQSIIRFKKTYPETIIGTVDIFRGDSWQLLLEKPELAIQVALFIRANLKATHDVDSKVSIATGTADRIVPEKISESSGKVFELSGQNLDNLRRRNRLVHSDIGAAIFLLDALVQQWSVKTALVVVERLLGKTHEEIAAKNNTTRQSITDVLSRADWWAIEPMLEEVKMQAN